MIKNHAQVAAWIAVLPIIFGSDRLSESMLKELILYVLSRAKSRQERLKSDSSLVEKFWEIYEYLNFRVTDSHTIEILNHSRNNNEVALNISHFQEVSKANNMDLIDWRQPNPCSKLDAAINLLRKDLSAVRF